VQPDEPQRVSTSDDAAFDDTDEEAEDGFTR
jgi:hypothetical protein